MGMIVMSNLVFLLIYLFCYNVASIYAQDMQEPPEPGCEIDPVYLNTPMMLKPSTSEIIYPKPFNVYMSVGYFTDLELVCPGTTVSIGQLDTHKESIIATCVDIRFFHEKDNIFTWDDITCSESVAPQVIVSERSCGNDSTETDIILNTKDGRSFIVFTVCYDKKHQRPLYTHHVILGTTERIYSPGSLPPIIDDGFYALEKEFTYYYNTHNQKEIINSLLREHYSSNKYIDVMPDSGYYFAVTYLTYDYDFFFAFYKNSTYRYINIAPMWLVVQSGNWDVIVTEVRNYGYHFELDLLKVWTGTYGISSIWDYFPEVKRLKMQNETMNEDVDTELRLQLHPKSLFIPELFWKILYRPDTKQALVFIVINNPFKYYELADKIICRDISNQVEWIYTTRQERDRGYSYACNYKDFKKAVPYAPDIEVDGVLHWSHSHIVM